VFSHGSTAPQAVSDAFKGSTRTESQPRTADLVAGGIDRIRITVVDPTTSREQIPATSHRGDTSCDGPTGDGQRIPGCPKRWTSSALPRTPDSIGPTRIAQTSSGTVCLRTVAA
jgi:hypothetical protein